MLGAIVAVTAVAGVLRYVHGASAIAAFAVSAVALAGLAWVVSFATEQVGGRFGTAVTGLLQSTLGNLPEFFVVVFALQAGERVVAETAILGSILVNALLVLGMVIIAGARRDRDGIMRFNARLPNDTATLLLLSSFIIVLIGLANVTHDPASHHAKTISIVGAVAILTVYGLWLRQYLTTGAGGHDTAAEEAAARRDRDAGAGEAAAGGRRDAPEEGRNTAERPALPTAVSLGLLGIGGAASAFVSDWFIHALEPTIHSAHISKAFAGLVIVAIAGNAVEHAVGIVLAHKGQADLAISVVKNSVAQIAAFLYPLLVLVSLLTNTTLTFTLAPVYIGALFGTAVAVWQITGDGEATLFEGAALMATFVILAIVAAFET